MSSTDYSYSGIVRLAWERHKFMNSLDGYPALVSLHGMARFAKFTKDDELMAEMHTFARNFLDGKVEKMGGAYGSKVYRFGGNFTAYLAARGELSGSDIDVLVKSAELLCNTHGRGPSGAFEHTRHPAFHWIDTVFGVCPFLLWTGQVANRQDFIDEACLQMKTHHEILFDPKIKLYYQAVNADGKGKLTPAHWSRGVGWGLYALAEMLYDLPKDHPDYPAFLKMYNDVLEGCLVTQKADGMWCQAMESHETYAESSGTGLIAYAMARGIKNGSLDKEKYQAPLLKALRALTSYIAFDGSVFNCCCGCLAPGEGTVEDYAKHRWIMNDAHSFGPMILAFGEAQHLLPLGLVPPIEELMKL